MTNHLRASTWVGLTMLISAWVQPVEVQAKEVKVKVGAPLPKSHRQLLKAGWQPAPQRADPSEELIGVEQVLHDAGYTEVSNCAMDVAMCQLSYRRGATQCLTLWVRGEEPADMTVSKVSRSCRGFSAPTRTP